MKEVNVMTSLILDSLEIHNFRTFHHLQIERLGRVNLIVGKNNVGKTSLLEALWLYAKQGSPEIIRYILEKRNESNHAPVNERGQNRQRTSNIRYLFHGREAVETRNGFSAHIVAGHTGLLSITVGWFIGQAARSQTGYKLVPYQEGSNSTSEKMLGVEINTGTQKEKRYLVEDILNPGRTWVSEAEDAYPAIFVPASGITRTEVEAFWDGIALTDREKDVIEALQIIAPAVERLNLIGLHDSQGSRIPAVKLKHYDGPVNLSSLGEGMNRMFTIALALVNAGAGMLLIDEIENGLHYTVQPDMWRLIFAVAHRLNVQVFATTHSWDCIAAFQQAANEHAEEGMLIRLGRMQDNIIATIFGEREMAIATRDQIEVR
jgi:ABC-type cobalamin/Fe3+-siderophores transport system ATPase subunit